MSALEFGIFDTLSSEPRGASEIYQRHIKKAQTAEMLDNIYANP